MLSLIRQLFGSGRATEWDFIKSSVELYPQGPIAILQMKSKEGSLLTGWVNKGYENYPYKHFCKYNFLIKVNLLDKIASPNPDLDMGTIEQYFLGNLRKASVCHLVARIATDEGLNLEMYLENQDIGMITLLNLSNNPNRLVSFTYESKYDSDWSAVSGLFKI